MSGISDTDVTKAIDQFLALERSKKLEPELKKLAKTDNDAEKLAIQTTADAIKQKYSKAVWMSDAANRMATQLKFGTHIAKGVHPDAKGDNVNFSADIPLADGIIGSQTLHTPELDANGNAAALPLAAFFNIEIGHIKLRQLIQQQHPAIKGVFDKEISVSNSYAQKFKTALDNVVQTPTAHERNKQLLWPLASTEKSDSYTCLVPLYPSSFTHGVFHKINDARYSEANKAARDNRYKKSVEQKPYIAFMDLAATILGGTKPQNVSLLMSKQGGRNYLLPSLPPKYSQNKTFVINKSQTTIFNKSLRFYCRAGFKELFAVFDNAKNNKAVRAQRKNALHLILAQLVSLAASIQQEYKAGWSCDYKLSADQKYWLDPYRVDLEGEETFAQAKQDTEWLQIITDQFSVWLNDQLRKQYPQYATDVDDTEYKEWKREIEAVIKASQRAKQGVF